MPGRVNQVKKSLHNSSTKNTGKATEKDHLPDGPCQPKACHGNPNSDEGEDQNWFAAQAVGGPAPGYHQEHLGQRKERFLQGDGQ